jgi:Flp pilus assembly protein TadG
MSRRRRPHEEQGQAFVEFVLVANVLLLVVFAIFQFGVVFSQYIGVTDAARAAARKAATYGGDVSNNTTYRDAALAQGLASAKASMSDPNMTVNWSVPNNTWIAGNSVTATVTVPADVSVLGFKVWSDHLTSSTTMRIEKRAQSG